MSPTRRRALAGALLGLLGVVLGGWVLLTRPEASSVPGGTAPSPPLALPTPQAAATPPKLPSPVAAPAGRVQPLLQLPLPRPAASERDGGLRKLAEHQQPSGPVDKRDNPGPNAARQMEIISYAFETLEEDVRECLQQWEATAPGQAAEVMIAFEIDADGLQRSWLEHQVEVPFGPRTCLANAVYGLDWSKIVDHPAKLTQRFELGRPDGGRTP